MSARESRIWLLAVIASLTASCVLLHQEETAQGGGVPAGGQGGHGPTVGGAGGDGADGGAGAAGAGGPGASGPQGGGGSSGALCDELLPWMCAADAQDHCVVECVEGDAGPIAAEIVSGSVVLSFVAGDVLHVGEETPAVPDLPEGLGAGAHLDLRGDALCLSTGSPHGVVSGQLRALWTCRVEGDAWTCSPPRDPTAANTSDVWGCAVVDGDAYVLDATAGLHLCLGNDVTNCTQVATAMGSSPSAAQLARVDDDLYWISTQGIVRLASGAGLQLDAIASVEKMLTAFAVAPNSLALRREDEASLRVGETESVAELALLSDDGYGRVVFGGGRYYLNRKPTAGTKHERLASCPATDLDVWACGDLAVVPEPSGDLDVHESIFGMAATEEHVYYTRQARRAGGPNHTVVVRFPHPASTVQGL